VACCSVQTPITALLAPDVASFDWRNALSDRFVMDVTVDRWYCFEAREMESLASRERIDLGGFAKIHSKERHRHKCIVCNCRQDGVAAVRSWSCSIDEARKGTA
jgi:hypothetical protein